MSEVYTKYVTDDEDDGKGTPPKYLTKWGGKYLGDCYLDERGNHCMLFKLVKYHSTIPANSQVTGRIAIYSYITQKISSNRVTYKALMSAKTAQMEPGLRDKLISWISKKRNSAILLKMMDKAQKEKSRTETNVSFETGQPRSSLGGGSMLGYESNSDTETEEEIDDTSLISPAPPLAVAPSAAAVQPQQPQQQQQLLTISPSPLQGMTPAVVPIPTTAAPLPFSPLPPFTAPVATAVKSEPMEEEKVLPQQQVAAPASSSSSSSSSSGSVSTSALLMAAPGGGRSDIIVMPPQPQAPSPLELALNQLQTCLSISCNAAFDSAVHQFQGKPQPHGLEPQVPQPIYNVPEFEKCFKISLNRMLTNVCERFREALTSAAQATILPPPPLPGIPPIQVAPSIGTTTIIHTPTNPSNNLPPQPVINTI